MANEKIDWTAKREQDSRELADNMGKLVNDMAHNKDAFIKQFQNQHRTIQQSSLQMLFKLIDECGTLYNQGMYDLRNEESYRKCAEISQHMRERSVLYDRWWKMPLI